MRQPRAHKSRKKAKRATNITARIPDDLVHAAPSDFDVGCVSCSLVFDDIYTVDLCGDHVWCINCALDQFTAATGDIELFPVNCCGKDHVLALQAVQYLLPLRVVQLYSTKLIEYTTERKKYEAFGSHKCKIKPEMMVELPPYTKDSRFKQCPGCKTPVELRDACNHMSCVCGYQYCFVCLLDWTGQHDCPDYGDPLYDLDARDTRGLHVRTGLDEGGYNRLGQHKYYPPRAPPPLLSNPREMARDVAQDHLAYGIAYLALPRPLARDARPDLIAPLANPPPLHPNVHDLGHGQEPHAGENLVVLPGPNPAIAEIVHQAQNPGLAIEDQIHHDLGRDNGNLGPQQPADWDTVENTVDDPGEAELQQEHQRLDVQPGQDALTVRLAALPSDFLPNPDQLDTPRHAWISASSPVKMFENWNNEDLEQPSIEDAMSTMFAQYDKRYDRLNRLPSIIDAFDIEELLAPTKDAMAYRDRSLINIALSRSGSRVLSYETIDLGHMTWFGILDMSSEDLDRLHGSSDRTWKPVHSRKYAYDTIYGFEPQSLDMYLETLVEKNLKWKEQVVERALEETAEVRDMWFYGEEVSNLDEHQLDHQPDRHPARLFERQFDHHDFLW
ncbi:hypothetical protein FKW77_002625 [Venturia effusa]|uniref:Uncharacterized protein n=1 Tax=Venturia effusa TaxID=50376 RepID=A0A517KW11_9PEZI|nr:hypothetical protein FKW77_002625 [Venturia effusa]